MATTETVDHRKRSRNVKQHTTYTEQAKLHALSVYAQTQSTSAASNATGIPHNTIGNWVKEEDSHEYLDILRQAMRSHMAHKYVEIATKSADAILDRLDNGDAQIGKDGEIVRLPVKARDLAVINSSAVDRHAMLTGMSQGSKAGSALQAIAANLIQALNAKTVDQTPASGSIADAEMIEHPQAIKPAPPGKQPRPRKK